MFSATLDVVVPYGSVSTHRVEVPPVADVNNPVIASIRSNQALTNTNGTAVFVGNTGARPVGWDTEDEATLRADLQHRARVIKATYDGLFHPDALEPAKALAQSAVAEVDRVEDIYDKWANSRLPVKQSARSPLLFGGASHGPIGLGSPLSPDIGTWAQLPTDRQSTVEYFARYAPLLQGERGGATQGNETPQHFVRALVAARARDRNRIRAGLRSAYRQYYCAEYGLAQSESWRENKKQSESGGGMILGTLPTIDTGWDLAIPTIPEPPPEPGPVTGEDDPAEGGDVDQTTSESGTPAGVMIARVVTAAGFAAVAVGWGLHRSATRARRTAA